MFITNSKTVRERMNQMPRTVGNRLSGEQVTFVKNTQDTNGDSLEFITNLDPEDGIFPHRHTYFTEIFEVLEGELTLSVNNRAIVLRADGGQPSASVSVGPYETHSFWNHTDSFVRFKVTMFPAGDFEPFIRIGYGLENDGYTFNYRRVKPGGPLSRFIRKVESILAVVPRSLLDVGVLGRLGGTYAPIVPIWMQRPLMAGLGALAKLLGRNKRLERYYMVPEQEARGDSIASRARREQRSGMDL